MISTIGKESRRFLTGDVLEFRASSLKFRCKEALEDAKASKIQRSKEALEDAKASKLPAICTLHPASK